MGKDIKNKCQPTERGTIYGGEGSPRFYNADNAENAGLGIYVSGGVDAVT